MSIRWFIVMIAFVGICCSIVGTVLGAMKASGREHLTVSLLMIGKDIYFIFIVMHWGQNHNKVTVSQTVSIRWFIVMIAFVGICCSMVSTVLGAMKATSHRLIAHDR